MIYAPNRCPGTLAVLYGEKAYETVTNKSRGQRRLRHVSVQRPVEGREGRPQRGWRHDTQTRCIQVSRLTVDWLGGTNSQANREGEIVQVTGNYQSGSVANADTLRPGPVRTRPPHHLVAKRSIEPRETQSDTAPSERVASLTYRRTEQTALYIETQEGDIVRLTFRNRESVKLKSAYAADGEQPSTETSLRTRSSSRLSVSVEGNLNADEAAAIQDAVDQATALAEDFFDGDVAAAFSRSAELGIDGDQLVQVSLNLKVRERLTYSAYSRTAGPPLAAPERVDARPVTLPARSPSVAAARPAPVPVAAPANSDSLPEAENATLSEPRPEAEGPQAAQTLGPQLGRADAFRLIGNFLNRLVDSHKAEEGPRSTGPLDVRLKLRVFESALTTLSETRSFDESPLPTLVHDTVDALAAQEADPLDLVA